MEDYKMTDQEIRAMVIECHAVSEDCIKTGAELGETEDGNAYEGEADAWQVYSQMPNSDQIGWWFAGYSSDFENDQA